MDPETTRTLALFGKFIIVVIILFFIFGRKDDKDKNLANSRISPLPLDRHADEVKVAKEAQKKCNIKQPEVVTKENVKPKVKEQIVKLSYTAKHRKAIAGNNNDIDWRKEGLLSLSGYRVGKTKGVKEPERKKILKSLYQDDDLLDVSDKAYAQEWGKKFTPKRYKKLNDSISTFLYQAEKRNNSSKVNLDLAISQWKSDIGYLKSVR
jgi:hypothetical protein